MQNSMNIETACQKIIATGHKIVEQKMVAGSWGNLSIKIDAESCAITPSGRAYDSLTAQDIVIVDMTGKKLVGDLIPSSETPLHTAIYKEIPEAQAIVHTHSIYASACAAMHKPIPAVVEDLVQIIGGKIDVAAYALPGTQALADNAVKALQNKKAALLANHGVVCWGTTLETALMTAEIVEKAAQIYCICETMGGAVLLPDADIAVMHDFYQQHYSKRQIGKGDETLE